MACKGNNLPVILHIPHSSTVIPEEHRKDILLSDEELYKELLLMTDSFTDLILDHVEGVGSLVFPVSRIVVDVERFRNDEEEIMARVGMGAVYTRTHEGRELRNLTTEKREQLLRKYYYPHHERFAELVERHLKEHGKCLILDIHSFPSEPLPYELDQDPDRPDICLGTDQFHTPSWLFENTRKHFEQAGFQVKENSPFSGTIVPLQFCGKDSRVLSLMIEINRKLIMDEMRGTILDRSSKTFHLVADLIKNIIKHIL